MKVKKKASTPSSTRLLSKASSRRPLRRGSSKELEETRALISSTAEGKRLEMAAKTAIDTARLCALWTDKQGDPVLASCRPPHGGQGHDDVRRVIKRITDPWWSMGAPRRARNKAGNFQWYGGSNHYRWLSDHIMWEYVYNYWQSGGHDRNLKRLLEQMPDKNREAVKRYMKEPT